MEPLKTSVSRLCETVQIGGVYDPFDLSDSGLPDLLKRQIRRCAVTGRQVYWGMPFDLDKLHILTEEPVEIELAAGQPARWLCFLHVLQDHDVPWHEPDQSPEDGFSAAMEIARAGISPLGAHAASYFIIYEDGSEHEFKIRNRYEINTMDPPWGENCFAAVARIQPESIRESSSTPWGVKQTGHLNSDRLYLSRAAGGWICALRNPHPEKRIVRLRLEGRGQAVVIWGLTACQTVETPIRWNRRQKVLIRTKKGTPDLVLKQPRIASPFDAGQALHMHLSDVACQRIQLDMGEILSVVPHLSYDDARWVSGSHDVYGNRQPSEYVVELVAHSEASLSVDGGAPIQLTALQTAPSYPDVELLAPADKRVTIRVVDSKHRAPIAVRLHIHGKNGEYLPPTNRHRLPNSRWFEDYGAEFTGPNLHNSTYIDGQTEVDLPLGQVFVEISKGFEYGVVREVVDITRETTELTFELERKLDWRSKGWITADTHVHFISPKTANLEGAAEGVNIVNLLASQWGELMSNAGDFDGKTTFSVCEQSERYLVRVGTENRQHVLGHISLLGYNGPMISPMCVGGADESAIGDPVDVLLTEWAEKCQSQDGIVVLPHSPQPRAESAATVISGFVDAMEVCSVNGFINPFTLANWYRFLNCGYHVPLAAGTDKMSASMEVGRARVYSRLKEGEELNYDSWKDSMRSGNTFATFGPLLEFSVDGHEAGSKLAMSGEGTVTVRWLVETIRYRLSSVEVVLNGEICAQRRVGGGRAEGSFDIGIGASSWACLLVRGIDNDGKERILAHSSAVMIDVAGSRLFSRLDAVSILEQIEGSIAYIENIGTRPDGRRSKEMMLILEQAHRALHDRLHQLGHDHNHMVTRDHH